MYLQKGLVLRDTVSKYEVNLSSNKEVMANVKVFGQNDGRTDGSKLLCLPSGA